MPKGYIFSEKDLRVLKRVVEDYRSRTTNQRPKGTTEGSWEPVDDYQASEVHIAIPQTEDGIPALFSEADEPGDLDIPGSALCDIYHIIDGELHPMAKELVVYNLSSTDLGRAWIPIAKDKHGDWIALNVGVGGGSSNETIDFIVDAWIPDDALTMGCDAVYATVTQVSCGASVSVGDQVIIYDPRLCWFILPVDILVGLQGTAILMESTFSGYQGASNFCADAPLEGECLWVVKSLCCREEIYAV